MRRLFLLALALCLPLSACGDDGTGPDNSHAGTYTLQTVNGVNLPVSLGVIEGIEYTILSGRVTLNADGTASETFRYRFTQGTSTAEEDDGDLGTYTRSGNAITVTWANQDPDTFSLSGNTLTLSESGFVAVFRK